MIDILLTKEVLSTTYCESLIVDDRAGGHVIFIGTVRNHTSKKKVLYLDFEAYGPMAEKEMTQPLIAYKAPAGSSLHLLG